MKTPTKKECMATVICGMVRAILEAEQVIKAQNDGNCLESVCICANKIREHGLDITALGKKQAMKLRKGN